MLISTLLSTFVVSLTRIEEIKMLEADIKEILKDAGMTSSNVEIETESGLKFKRKLRINDLGLLCIGEYKSKFPNYLVNLNVASKWKSVKIIK